MNSFLYYLAFLILIKNAFSYNINEEKFYYKIKFLEVPLDHFNYVTNHTFTMRYLVNDSFIKNDNEINPSPILFYTGNEGDIELFAQNTGFIWDAGKHLNALIIFAEHRYYGQSLPFGNKSFDSITHLGYLTAEQALADYAHLLKNIMGDKQRPVIAIGGSYGGMLAAWFRIKYPHFITGALASSAPVLQFTGLTPCNVFSRIVTSVFSTAYTRDCSENIKKSWDILKNFSAQDKGRTFLNTQFNFCKNLTKPDDIDKFFDYLEDVYGNLAMANYPYEANFLAPLPAYPVRMFCGQLAKSYSKDDELIIALQKAVNIYANYTGKTKCLDYSSAYQPSLASDVWDFQSCTEMVMPMCSDKSNDMFRDKKWDIKKYSDDCYKKFGIRPREYEMITRYGGKNMDSTSNIIFSNGLLDPWSGGGVLRTSNSKIIVLIIPEGAHHLDLRSKNDKDPASVQQAREIELSYMQSWISDFYN